jgi:hydrogenase-4 component F
MALALVLLPLVMAGIAAAIPSNRLRPWVLLANAIAHGSLAAIAIARPDLASLGDWLALDPPGRLVLLVVSVLYLFCAIYCVGYLEYRGERSNRVFVACLSIFPGVVSLVALSQHLGLVWVAIEATTLSTAPLIYFNHSKLSIEATWKYLLVGSVGIALALLGTFFMAYSAAPAGLAPTLTYGEILTAAPSLSKPWLRVAFVLLLVGYGTKMGLAPMHTWKPDAYGEAPGVVGAILAGGVTSCAFLAFLRVYHVFVAAGEFAFVSRLLLPMGLLSMAVAGLFMIGQRDFKRMLAYSSVEHMGILIVGLGIGAPALYGTMLHVLTNGATKGVLFLSAGNIHRAYASKSTEQVSGAMRRMPLSAGLFLAGFLAITGSPPFGPFISEFSILNGAFDAGRFAVAGLFLAFLLVVFVGMGRTVLSVVQGRPPAEVMASPYRDGFWTAAPIVALMSAVLLLGIWIPAPLGELIGDAAHFLGAQP